MGFFICITPRLLISPPERIEHARREATLVLSAPPVEPSEETRKMTPHHKLVNRSNVSAPFILRHRPKSQEKCVSHEIGNLLVLQLVFMLQRSRCKTSSWTSAYRPYRLITIFRAINASGMSLSKEVRTLKVGPSEHIARIGRGGTRSLLVLQ